jgi:23S rRNA (uracil1939-C5)-methyltransferase
LELEIEKLSLGGDGVARKDGLVYFVPLAAPGDLLSVKITEKKKNFARAEIIKILKPGPSRLKPPCPVFGKCGGCNWQHLSYHEQLKQKNLIVREQLRRVTNAETIFLDIVPSPKPFNYRNRIQLKCDGKNIGFYAKSSHQIVGFDECLISDPQINSKIRELKNGVGKSIPERIELFLDETGQVHQTHENSNEEEAFGFSQVNTEQNLNLIQTVLQWTKDFKPRLILDLYSGSGNFSFPFVEAFSEATVVAVELSSASVGRGQMLQEKRKIASEKLQFRLSDVGQFLKKQSVDSADIIFLDPPRIGCAEEVISSVAQQRPERIFYVSCNPSALARDLARMQLVAPWKVVRVQPFDMFPQTDHIEVLVELKIDTE